MFDVKRMAPWDTIGTKVHGATSSEEVMKMAGLDWTVHSCKIYIDDKSEVPDLVANVRSSDNKCLGIVSKNYKIVQNADAFSFMDQVLGEGVTYETAGALQGGKRIWVLAHIPGEYKFLDDAADPFLLFTTSHNGVGSIKVCITPVRVICMNTINLAIHNASRSWSIIHKGLIEQKLENARDTLIASRKYMHALCDEMVELNKIKLTQKQVEDYVCKLIPMPLDPSQQCRLNVNHKRDELMNVYLESPDLAHVDKSAYRLINAVSDYATHARPLKMTKNFYETRLIGIIDGNNLIDKSYKMLKEAA